jgi:hypothetical protein
VSAHQRPRRLGLATIAVLLAAVGWGGVVLGTRVASAASNPGRYLADVKTHATGWRSSGLPGRPERDQAWLESHTGALIATGRQACDWLAHQPDAPDVDPTYHFDRARMAMHYVKHHHSPDQPLARLTRWSVVDQAWHLLCPSVGDAKTAPPSLSDD